VRFIKIFALIIEFSVIHIYFKPEILGKQRLAIMEKICPIDYSIKLSLHVN